MRSTNVVSLLFLAALLTAAGCQTSGDAVRARGQGKSRIYNAPFDTVWDTAPKAIGELGLDVVMSSKEEGSIVAQKPITAFSAGEHIAVFVERVNDEQTKVEVVSKKAMATNIFAWNWEKPILNKLSEMLSSQ